MSHFLQRLVDRHRGDALSREATQKVLPRPRSRFENNSRSDASISNEFNRDALQSSYRESDNWQNSLRAVKNADQISVSPVSPVSAETKQFAHDVAVLEQPAVRDIAPEPATARTGKESWNERIGSLELLSKNQSSQPEVLPNVSKNQNTAHRDKTRLTGHDDQSAGRQGELVDRLQQPIQTQTIPQRLDNRQQTGIDGETVVQPLSDLRLSSQRDYRAPVNSGPLNHLTTPSEAKPNFVQSTVKEKQQSTENRAPQHETVSSGLLQLPNWLAELQAELNARWQEMNNQKNPETVVNVTIGRVEVKAVQSSIAQPSRTRAKATSVMTLDDYLKQRENKVRR